MFMQELESDAELARKEADRLRAAEKFMVVGTGEAECKSCGYTYSPAQGDPEYPIAKGTTFNVRFVHLTRRMLRVSTLFRDLPWHSKFKSFKSTDLVFSDCRIFLTTGTAQFADRKSPCSFQNKRKLLDSLRIRDTGWEPIQ